MRLWQLGSTLILMAAACSNNGSSATAERRPTIIYVTADAQAEPPPPSTGKEDSGVAPGTSETGGTSVIPSTSDGGFPQCSEQGRFPSCKGTADEVSNCILNLPTTFGLQVITPDPTDYNACKNK